MDQPFSIFQGDSVSLPFPDKSIDLVVCSPPYEAARTYGVDFKLKGEEYVAWAVERFKEHLRVCKGLVAWVIEGQTRKFRWSATPALLMADLHRSGVNLRKPPAFHRIGIPGSGGPDWLRNDYEFIICATHGKLPWSDNRAMGHPPKWAPGGEMSNRDVKGKRKNEDRNQWGGTKKNGSHRKSGGECQEAFERPSPVFGTPVPAIANPGNTIKASYTCDEVAAILSEASDVTHHLVGGGVMGDKECHENEAPFPESLAEFLIRSFCPPDGVVFDGFCGSGTTVATAVRWGRYGVGCDIRESQVELATRRCAKAVWGESLPSLPIAA